MASVAFSPTFEDDNAGKSRKRLKLLEAYLDRLVELMRPTTCIFRRTMRCPHVPAGMGRVAAGREVGAA